MRSTIRRLGCFFWLVSAILLLVFLASDSAGKPEYTPLITGMAGILIGWWLWKRGSPPPQPSGRFRILRRRQDHGIVEDPDGEE